MNSNITRKRSNKQSEEDSSHTAILERESVLSDFASPESDYSLPEPLNMSHVRTNGKVHPQKESSKNMTTIVEVLEEGTKENILRTENGAALERSSFYPAAITAPAKTKKSRLPINEGWLRTRHRTIIPQKNTLELRNFIMKDFH